MQVILASAKIMREKSPVHGVMPSEPCFIAQAAQLASDMSRLSVKELSELLNCSLAIAEQNKGRYAVFGTDEAEIMPAVFAYNGQAYKHLKADTLSIEDLEWANIHLWISTCLYGLLRPLDGINTYRMEGGYPLPSTQGKKVSDYWKPYLTDTLIASVRDDDGVLIYLDTEEFRNLFDWKKVCDQVTVIEPEFHTLSGKTLKTPSVWAKTCRGAMARFIIQNRITNEEELESFSYCGFEYDKSLSRDGHPAFIRKETTKQ